jgi:hypothetical protein
MELAQLKNEIHASVEKLNDEELLQEVAELLGMHNRQTKNDYEESAEFWQGINKARQSIADGKGIPDQEARALISAKILGAK